MKAQLEAVIDELKQLKASGQAGVYLGDDTLAALDQLSATAVPAKNRSDMDAQPAYSPKREVKTPESTSNDLLAEWKQVSGKSANPEPAAPKTAPPKQSKGVPDWIKPIPAPTDFDLPEGDKQTRWSWLRDKVLNDSVCREHARTEQGRKVVFGVGNLDADIFFCGEAPGADEAIQGEPFVGKAGHLLGKIIKTMGLSREQVYIGNILNWRPEHDKPSGNRPPADKEIAYCLPYLEAQVAIVQPRVIVALGATAANGLLGQDPKRTVRSTRGKWFQFKGIPTLLTYHPSYLLRDGTNATKRMVWEDMLLAMEAVDMPISDKQRSFFL